MPAKPLDRLLSDIETARYLFGQGESVRVVKLLRALDALKFPDSATLIRFHEALLFLRAFPQSPAVLRATERILNNFHERVEALRKSGADMDDFDPLEVSGIAGTAMEDTLSFDVARWLIRRMPGKVGIAWDNYEPGRELGNTGPRFMPLLEDDAYVEADTPWRRWLETGANGGGKKTSTTPAWLIERFEQPPPARSTESGTLRIAACAFALEPGKFAYHPHAQLAIGSKFLLPRWPAHQPQPGFSGGGTGAQAPDATDAGFHCRAARPSWTRFARSCWCAIASFTERRWAIRVTPSCARIWAAA